MAFCEVSQDQSPGTPAAAGDFGFKVLTSSDPADKTKKLSAELANGSLGPPASSLKLVAGITYDVEGAVSADDAYKRDKESAGGWAEMQKRNRNNLMHATNGNGSFLYFMLSLLMALSCSMCNACASCCDLRFLVNVACCIVSLQCAMSLSKAKKLKTRRVPCRKICKRRFHAVHLHKRRCSCFCKLICLLCLVSPFTMVCI